VRGWGRHEAGHLSSCIVSASAVPDEETHGKAIHHVPARPDPIR